MKPALCRLTLAASDHDGPHSCVMWKGHTGIHVCVCGHTYRHADTRRIDSEA